MRACALCGFADAQKVLKRAVINANVTDPSTACPSSLILPPFSIGVGAEGHRAANIAHFVPSNPCDNKSKERCHSCPVLCVHRPCLCLL